MSLDDGAPIHQWEYVKQANQRWKLVPMNDGSHEIVSVHSGKCLDVAECRTDSGAPIHQWGCHGQDNQRWKLTDVGGGTFEIRSVLSGKCLDATASTESGARTVQADCFGAAHQRFRFDPVDDQGNPVAGDIELTWSSAGPIAGKQCTQIAEAIDPHSWDDNYLCANQDLGLRWSSAGPLANMSCLQIDEPSDPHAWHDNYLCAPRDLGLRWSFAGAIAGLKCVNLGEPLDPVHIPTDVTARSGATRRPSPA